MRTDARSSPARPCPYHVRGDRLADLRPEQDRCVQRLSRASSAPRSASTSSRLGGDGLAERQQPLGCLRSNRAIPRRCQSVWRLRKRLSITRGVRVVDDRSRDEPALPAGLRGAVGRRRCPRRSGGSRRPSRRSPRASSGASAGRRRRAASRPAPARPDARAVVRDLVLVGRRSAGAAFARQIVPSTVGKRRSDGCQVPSGHEARAGPTRPARGMRVREARRAPATAPGSGTASGFETRTYSPVVAATPAVRRSRRTAAAARSRAPGAPQAASRRCPGGSRSRRARRPAAPSAGSDALELARVAVRDDDGGDRHRRAPPGRPRASRSRSHAPRNALRPLEPGATASSVALGERAPHAVRELAPPRRRRRRRRRPRAARARATATTGVPLAIASSTGSPKPSKRDACIEAGRAAVELGELLLAT